MPDFVYDLLTLPTPKTNRAAIPAGEDPTKWVSATDWNLVAQACLDLRAAIRTGRFFGFAAQATAPSGSTTDYVWLDTLKRLIQQLADGTTRQIRAMRYGTVVTDDGTGQTKDIVVATLGSDNQATLVKANVITYRTAGLSAVGFTLLGVYRRAAGLVVQEGDVNIQRIPLGAGTPSATLAIAGTNVVARVTGTAADSFTWRAESEETIVTS